MDNTAFKSLKEFDEPSALSHTNDQILFFLFVFEKEGNVLGVLTPKHWTTIDPLVYYSQKLNPVAQRFPPTPLP